MPLDYEGVGGAGSMLGTKALQIFDNTTCVVRAVLRWTEFYSLTDVLGFPALVGFSGGSSARSRPCGRKRSQA